METRPLHIPKRSDLDSLTHAYCPCQADLTEGQPIALCGHKRKKPLEVIHLGPTNDTCVVCLDFLYTLPCAICGRPPQRLTP